MNLSILHPTFGSCILWQDLLDGTAEISLCTNGLHMLLTFSHFCSAHLCASCATWEKQIPDRVDACLRHRVKFSVDVYGEAQPEKHLQSYVEKIYRLPSVPRLQTYGIIPIQYIAMILFSIGEMLFAEILCPRKASSGTLNTHLWFNCMPASLIPERTLCKFLSWCRCQTETHSLKAKETVMSNESGKLSVFLG